MHRNYLDNTQEKVIAVTAPGEQNEDVQVTSESDTHFSSPPFSIVFQFYIQACIILLLRENFNNDKKKTHRTHDCYLSGKERCLLNLSTC